MRVRVTILAVLAGFHMALCVWTARSSAPRIEADISARVNAILGPVPTITSIVEGRDVALIGRVRSASDSAVMREAIDSLLASIGSLDGVRSVRGEIEITRAGGAS